jgi:hypothetical protein
LLRNVHWRIVARGDRIMRRLVIVVLSLLAACTLAPDVQTDFDRTADFSRFHSFRFEGRSGSGPDGYTSLTAQRVRAAIEREMKARGYVLAAADADLLVNFSSGLQDRLRVVTRPGPWGPRSWGPWRDYWGPGWGWPGYWDTIEPYTENIITIDLIDREHRRMVWQGAARSITASRFGEPSEAEIDAAVAAIFERFPFRAGLAAQIAPAPK